MQTEIESAIKALTGDIKSGMKAVDALQTSQAVVNLMNALALSKSIIK